MNKEYNVGDKVWVARYDRQELQKTCPICFGKMRVRVILGDESQIETDCTFCERGFTKYGYITEYDYVPAVKQVEITRKEVNEGKDGRHVEYCYEYCCSTSADIFDTKEEAESALVRLIKEVKAKDLKRLEYGKDNNPKKYSWHVGYYQREKKTAEKKIQYCDEKITYFKGKVKEEKSNRITQDSND